MRAILRVPRPFAFAARRCVRAVSVVGGVSPPLLARAAPRGARALSSLPPHTLVGMPALSPTMEQGTLVKWSKAVGDELKAGDVLAEVATDKATVEFEVTDGGCLARQLVPAGTADVRVGQLVAVIV